MRFDYGSVDYVRKTQTMPFIDYVLVHKSSAAAAAEQSKSIEQSIKLARMEALRCLFEKQLQQEGFDINREVVGDHVYVTLECPFWRLANEAERVHIEMPLKGKKLKAEQDGCCSKLRSLVSHGEEDDYISIDFEVSKGHLFENYDEPDKFFRQSLRSLLVHIILTEIDVSNSFNEECADEEHLIASICGLAQLLHQGVYTDAFVLHEPSAKDGSCHYAYRSGSRKFETSGSSSVLSSYENSGDGEFRQSRDDLQDARAKLDQRWPNLLKRQPMGLIRDYFGEEIALYFAWSGLLSFSVFLPALFGLAIFCYGLYLSVNDGAAVASVPVSMMNLTTSLYTTTARKASFATTTAPLNSTTVGIPGIIKDYAQTALKAIEEALDNDITPWYSLIMCIWGTLFLELWKRRNAVLAYEWDVEHFESNEPDRPQFVGKVIKDAVTGEVVKKFSASKKCVKYVVSLTVFILMVCIVLIISVSVITYRIFLRIDYCTVTNSTTDAKWDTITCTVVTSFGATLLNAIAIMILGKVYEMLAVKLTEWENHKTETDYRDALIVKLFAFAFANSYTSLFYIAFFQNDKVYGESGMFNRGSAYRETCGGSCMTMLSLQVLVLIILKPLPKVLTDVIIPAAKKLFAACKVKTGWQPYLVPNKDGVLEYITRESLKPQLGDFTLSEYTEKVIQYGYLMLFAVSMPLAPLIVLLTNIADRYVDSKRMLWWYRRPVARIAQDIGVWYYILQFLNISGVVTNAYLIAFTSKWGNSNLLDVESRLAFGIIFEHVVFALKFLLSLAIPDVPATVKDAIRRKHFLIKAVLKAEQPTGKQHPQLQGKRSKVSLQSDHENSLTRRNGRPDRLGQNFSMTEV